MNISEKAKKHADSCRFCWMCRHVCPIGNADGQERNTARARALMVSLVVRGTEKLEDIADNMYECTLCGACTNNCKTGWDPKIFIQEVKTNLVLEGKAPEYINELIQRYFEKGTIYKGKRANIKETTGNTFVLFGQNALYNDQKSIQKAYELLNNPAYEFEAQDTGYILWFLTGKTNETVERAKRCAELLNKYKEVVVYNPVELSFMLHEWNEWGIEVKAKLVGYVDKLLKLAKTLNLKKGEKEYSLQDNYAQARELDDVKFGRKLISLVGENKEMLLIGKEANMAGNLIMNEYMPEKMLEVAKNRWVNAINMGCKTLVTMNPDEHVLLKATAPSGYRVLSLEEMLLENK